MKLPWGKTSNDEATDPLLRTYFTSVYTKSGRNARREKVVAEGFIVPAREVHRCDLELLL